MLPDFKQWREGAGTPYANAPGADFADANIWGAGRKQKSANWFKSPPKLHGTPPPPKGSNTHEMAGTGGAPGLSGNKGNFNIWGAQPNGKPYPQHMKKKLKREATEEPYWEVYLDNDEVKSIANKAKDLLKDSCPNSESYLVVKFHANRADLSIAKELLSKEFKVVEVEDES